MLWANTWLTHPLTSMWVDYLSSVWYGVPHHSSHSTAATYNQHIIINTPCPGQRNPRNPVPVPVTGMHYNSLLWMCTLNTLTWLTHTHTQRDKHTLCNAINVSSSNHGGSSTGRSGGDDGGSSSSSSSSKLFINCHFLIGLVLSFSAAAWLP